ncbi:MAG: hypothetical protein FMNOHCHN_02856 [Ignavibacteriaceae bacterium]|nr:hypothetical protein [Ignavibacteriaceae bacterium]
MIRIFLLLLIILPGYIISQEFQINKSHPVNGFLDRYYTITGRTIENFLYPVHRDVIFSRLNELSVYDSLFTKTDKELFNQFISEFGPQTDVNVKELTSFENYEFLSEKESYFYFSNSSDSFSVGINLIAEIGYHSNFSDGSSANTVLLGGDLSARFGKHVTFNLRGLNGIFSGEKSAIRDQRRYNSNYKLTDDPNSAFYDETEGNISLTYPGVSFTLARGDLSAGLGQFSPMIRDLYPRSDFFSLNLSYGILNYTFAHGSLLAESVYLGDSITGGIRDIPEKYIVFHKASFNISDAVKMHFGEMVVYSGRGMDPGYLNPFNFYKTVEHSRVDRDNTALFTAFESVLPYSSKFYLTLLMDDIDYAKLGSGWWGNQTLLHGGITSFPVISSVPTEISLEILQIQPYVFSHRIKRNNFANLSVPVWGEFSPNSVNYLISAGGWFSDKFYSKMSYTFTQRALNEYDSAGNLVKNYGSNVNEGHRSFDSETIGFLEGIKDKVHSFEAGVIYQPVNNYFLKLIYKFSDSSVGNTNFASFYLTIKL